MKLTQSESAVLSDLVQKLRSEEGALRVVLYGSAAQDALDSESDIDLLVVLPAVDWETEKRVGGLAFEAGLEIDRVISTLCFSDEELTPRYRQASPLIQNIEREGLLL